VSIRALVGGGTASGGSVTGQRALIEAQFDPALAGAWVRAWTQGLDPREGLHFRLDGGGGRVRADGAVSLVVDLPDGDVTPDAQMGVDVEVVARRERLYMDVRFARPAPPGGGAAAR